MLNLLNYFPAFNAMTSYMEVVAKESRVAIRPSTVVTGLGLCSILAVLVSTCLVDRIGRRCLLIISGFFTAVSFTVLAYHFWLVENGKVYNGWVPIACLVVYSTSYCFGQNSIPSALVGELFSPRLKSMASLVFSITFAGFSAISSWYFIPVSKLNGYSSAFLFYAVGTFASCIFYYFWVPETKGKSLQDIQNSK